MGYPRIDAFGTAPRQSDGKVIPARDTAVGSGKLYTTVSIQAGNSGGPLLNLRGEVVGVIAAMLGVKDMTQGKLYTLDNASCAIKVSSLKRLMHHLPAMPNRLDELSRAPAPLPELGARIHDSVLIVVAR